MLFSDPDGDALTFGVTGLPAGLAMDTATGSLTGTTPGALGVHHLTVTATDPGAAFVSLNFDLNLIVGNTVTASVITRGGLDESKPVTLGSMDLASLPCPTTPPSSPAPP